MLRGSPPGPLLHSFRVQSCTIGAAHALGQCALSPDAAVVDGLIGVIDSAMLQLDLHARQELLPAAALGEDEDGPVFAAEDFDFVALERRRAVAEAACSLGLVGQRVLSAATDAETGAEESSSGRPPSPFSSACAVSLGFRRTVLPGEASPRLSP